MKPVLFSSASAVLLSLSSASFANYQIQLSKLSPVLDGSVYQSNRSGDFIVPTSVSGSLTMLQRFRSATNETISLDLGSVPFNTYEVLGSNLDGTTYVRNQENGSFTTDIYKFAPDGSRTKLTLPGTDNSKYNLFVGDQSGEFYAQYVQESALAPLSLQANGTMQPISWTAGRSEIVRYIPSQGLLFKNETMNSVSGTNQFTQTAYDYKVRRFDGTYSGTLGSSSYSGYTGTSGTIFYNLTDFDYRELGDGLFVNTSIVHRESDNGVTRRTSGSSFSLAGPTINSSELVVTRGSNGFGGTTEFLSGEALQLVYPDGSSLGFRYPVSGVPGSWVLNGADTSLSAQLAPGSGFAGSFGVFNQYGNFFYAKSFTTNSFGVSETGWVRGEFVRAVPEPGTVLALGAGIAVLARRRRRAK